MSHTGIATATNPTTVDLDAFLSAPPIGATELHVRKAIWRPPMAKRIAGAVADEVAFRVIGGGDDLASEPTQWHLILSWLGGPKAQAQQTLGELETARGTYGAEVIASIVRSSAERRMPTSFTREVATVGRQLDHTGVLFRPRPLPSMGVLGHQTRLLDNATNFDVAIDRIDRPGLVSRKVLRQEDVVVSFRIQMDHERLKINYSGRKEDVDIDVATDDIVAIAEPSREPLLITPTQTHALPSLAGWSRVDFRGRDLTCWAYERIMHRVGV